MACDFCYGEMKYMTRSSFFQRKRSIEDTVFLIVGHKSEEDENKTSSPIAQGTTIGIAVICMIERGPKKGIPV